MRAIPGSKFLHGYLDQPMRRCAAAYRQDLRADFVVLKPGEYVYPRYVVDCADGDAVGVNMLALI